MTFKRLYVRCIRDVRFPICVGMLFVMLLMTGFIPHKHVTISVDGQRIELNTPYSAVDNILSQAGVAKNEKDEYNVTADDNGDVVINVRRAVPVVIEYQGEPETMLTTKSTVAEIMKELGYVGNRYVIDKSGDMGVVADMHIKVTYVEPVTIPAKPTVDTGIGAIPYSQHMTMEATAYIPSDGGGSGITATGMVAQHGVVAVDPQVIPLGTKVYIPVYGVAIAADTGGAIRGNRIDLCMDTYHEAISFGRGDVEVYILD